MRADYPKVWFIGIVLLLATSGTSLVHGQVNSWANPQSGTWNWATAANWQLGLAPSIDQSSILITNAASGLAGSHFRIVTIDSTTINQPETMTVSNVFVSAPGSGPNGNHNSLFLNNAGLATPLHIISSLIISNGGAVNITNSVLLVDRPPPFILPNGVFIDGILQLNTGVLITTNTAYFIIGNQGFGQMTVLSGTWQGPGVTVGNSVGSQGVLTLAGGASTLSSLLIGELTGAAGTVSMTGGFLTTAFTDVGYLGPAQMAVSGGTWLVSNVYVGTFFDGPPTSYGTGEGTLTLAGGTTTIEGGGPLETGLYLALDENTTGTVWMTGGQLTTTNTTTVIGVNGTGHMTMSNGTWRAGSVIVAGSGFMPSQGTLSLVGGTTMISSGLVVGDCAIGAEGQVDVRDSTFYVTNASHTAFIDVENGTFTVNASGTLVVDVFVMTNPCANFINAGGVVNYRTAILDPNGDADVDGLPNSWEQMHGLDPLDPVGDNGPFGDPDGDGYNNLQEYLAGSDPQNPLSTPLLPNPPPFEITSILRSNNNVVLTWATIGGTTNQVQVTNGGSAGSYSTNSFANLGAQTLIIGSGAVTTNYLDVGGATNKPARYYRIRLVP